MNKKLTNIHNLSAGAVGAGEFQGGTRWIIKQH